MNVLCLDLEGVLVPEIWAGGGRGRTGIDALNQTTREHPRVRRSDAHAPRRPPSARCRADDHTRRDRRLGRRWPGAEDFLAWAPGVLPGGGAVGHVSTISPKPLMAKLGPSVAALPSSGRWRTTASSATGFAKPTPRRQAVRGFQSMNYRVLAAGDSFNDISMLEQADFGVFRERSGPACGSAIRPFDAVEGLAGAQGRRPRSRARSRRMTAGRVVSGKAFAARSAAADRGRDQRPTRRCWPQASAIGRST